ncbi:hypothetical protein VroAM7_34330 [Vibrio rotiferianus]|uniref:Uncharacterized protein n=1 Tax=Vibrio rotiferianus TaxID=190895 RepID=A0A510IEV1_9VIBR|nr:hypothetical protein VroAM7_34330 [Vibrio rotiferianus]
MFDQQAGCVTIINYQYVDLTNLHFLNAQNAIPCTVNYILNVVTWLHNGKIYRS